MNDKKFSLFGLSVFAVASCLVYLIETIESVPLLAQTISFPVRVKGIESQFELPLMWIPITIFHTVIAARLYAHAWAIDEAPFLRRPQTKKTGVNFNFLLFLEWILRGIWVTLISYLPNAYSKIATGKSTIVGGPLEWYYAATFGTLLFWDLIMYKKIIAASTELSFVNRGGNGRELRISELKKRWLGYDIVLFILSLCLCAFGVTWKDAWLNWKFPVYILILTIGTFICFTQMFIWVPEIFRSRQVAETAHLKDS